MSNVRLMIGTGLAFMLAQAAVQAATNSRICEIAWTWGGIFAWFGVFSGC